MRNGKTMLSPSQIGGIITGVKNGKSYTHFARKYGMNTSSIRFLCEKHGIYTKFKEPRQLRKSKKKSIWLRLFG